MGRGVDGMAAAAVGRSTGREAGQEAKQVDAGGPSREPGRAADVTGVVVLGACAMWSLVSAAGRDARPEGVLLAVLAVAAGYACGRISGSLLPVAAATGMSLAALALALASRQGVPGPTASMPSGHSGACAALLVLAAGAACCAAPAATSLTARRALWSLALGVAVAATALGSVTGSVGALGVLACSLATARMRRRLPVLVGLALMTALVVGACWAVAAEAVSGRLSTALEARLTHERVVLWHDAITLAEENPLVGVGPDRFGAVSPTAQAAPVPDGTPHSAPLQQAAEQGVVGVVLLGAAFCWLLHGLRRSPRSTAVVLAAAATLTALALLAAVGNALSFTPVTAGAGLLAGLATARRPAPDCVPEATEAPHTPETATSPAR